MRQLFCGAGAELWPLIAAVGKDLPRKRKNSEQTGQHQDTTSAVLNVGRVYHCWQLQAYGVGQYVPFLAFGFLAGIIPLRLNMRAPFSRT